VLLIYPKSKEQDIKAVTRELKEWQGGRLVWLKKDRRRHVGSSLWCDMLVKQKNIDERICHVSCDLG
jgi:hypothetical protein